MDIKIIPSEKVLDSTLAVMREGYHYIRNRCQYHQSDIFRTRIYIRPVICFTGEEASAYFYNEKYFNLNGGNNGYQDIISNRSENMASFGNTEHFSRLIAIIREQFMFAVSRWAKMDRVVLVEASQEVMFRVACQWAGIYMLDADVSKRSKDFAILANTYGELGVEPGNLRRAQRNIEKWIKKVLTQIREGKIITTPATATHILALETINGKLPDLKMAVSEIIKILKPVVSLANVITFAALALHSYPLYKEKIRDNDNVFLEWFSREVVRYYPSIPYLSARAKDTMLWKGYKIPKGGLVLFDIYGTNHDPRKWDRPEDFRPERFQNTATISPVTSGNGTPETMTIEALKTAIKILACNLEYSVPEQDLSIDFSIMPAYPKSHFVMQNVLVIKKVPQLV